MASLTNPSIRELVIELNKVNEKVESQQTESTEKLDNINNSLTTLENKVDESVNEVKTELTNTTAALNETKDLVTKNEQAIADNAKLITDTETKLVNDIATAKTDLEATITTNKEALETAIATNKETLETAIADAKTELDNKKQNVLVAGNNVTLTDNGDNTTTVGVNVDTSMYATIEYVDNGLATEKADREAKDTELGNTLTTEVAAVKELIINTKTELTNDIDGKVGTVTAEVDNIKSKVEEYDTFLADTADFLAKKSYVDAEIIKTQSTSSDDKNELLALITANTNSIGKLDTLGATFTSRDNLVNVANELATADTNLNTKVDTLKQTIDTDIAGKIQTLTDEYKAADVKLDTEYKAADADLQAKIDDLQTKIGEANAGYIAADTALEQKVTTAYTDADNALRKEITDAYVTADAVVTSAFKDADTALKTELTTLIDTKLDNTIGTALEVKEVAENSKIVKKLNVIVDRDDVDATNTVVSLNKLNTEVGKLNTEIGKKQNKLVTDGTDIILKENAAANTTTISLNKTNKAESVNSITGETPIVYHEVKDNANNVIGHNIKLNYGIGLTVNPDTGKLRVGQDLLNTVAKTKELGEKITNLETNKADKVEIENLRTIKVYGNGNNVTINRDDVVLHGSALYICLSQVDITANKNWDWNRDFNNGCFKSVDTDTISTFSYGEAIGKEIGNGCLVIKDNILYIVNATFTNSGNWETDKQYLTPTNLNLDLANYYTMADTYAKTELYNKTEIDKLFDAKSDLQVPVAQSGKSYKAGQLLLKVAPSSVEGDEGYPPTVYITTKDIDNYEGTTSVEFLKKVVDDTQFADTFAAKVDVGDITKLSTDVVNDPVLATPTSVVEAINNLVTKVNNGNIGNTDAVNNVKDELGTNGNLDNVIATGLKNSDIDPNDTTPTTIVDAINNLKTVAEGYSDAKDALLENKLTGAYTTADDELRKEIVNTTTAYEAADAAINTKVGETTGLNQGLRNVGDTDGSKTSLVDAINKVDNAVEILENGDATIGGNKTYTGSTTFNTPADTPVSFNQNPVVNGVKLVTLNEVNDLVPIATTTKLGKVKIGTGLSIDTDGVLSTTVYTDASKTVKGIVQVGNNIDVNNGVISVANANGNTTLGVVKAGDNITITDGVLSLSNTAIPQLGKLENGKTYNAGQIGLIDLAGVVKLVRVPKDGYQYDSTKVTEALDNGSLTIITDTSTSADSGHIEFFVEGKKVTNGTFVFYRGCIFRASVDTTMSAAALDTVLANVIAGTTTTGNFTMEFGLTPGVGVKIDKLKIDNNDHKINNKVSVVAATSTTLGGVIPKDGLVVDTDGSISTKSDILFIDLANSKNVGQVPKGSIVKSGNVLYVVNTPFDKNGVVAYDTIRNNVTPITSGSNNIISFDEAKTGDVIKSGQLITHDDGKGGGAKLYIVTDDVTITDTTATPLNDQFNNALTSVPAKITASSVTGDLESINDNINTQLANKTNLIIPNIGTNLNSIACPIDEVGQLFVYNNELYISKVGNLANGSAMVLANNRDAYPVRDLTNYYIKTEVDTKLSGKMDHIADVVVGKGYKKGQLVLVSGVLYRVIKEIPASPGYTANTHNNTTYLTKIVDLSSIGTLANLTTTSKDNLVNAINEVNGKVGTVGSLTTTKKDNLVNAVNEVSAKVATNTTDIATLKDRTGIANIATVDKTINTNGATGNLVAIINALYDKVKALETELAKKVELNYFDSVVYSANTILELTNSTKAFVYNNSTINAVVGTNQTFTVATDATSVGLTSSDATKATATITGNTLTITPKAAGSTTVVLTAAANGKSQATFKLIVSVK